MIELQTLVTAFLLGIMGAGHCLGMCGGIAGALAFAVPNAPIKSRTFLLLNYNLGRMCSYSLMGLIAGYLGSRISLAQGLPVLKALSGLLLIAMGLYLANWWMVLRHLEKAGAQLWKFLQPLANKLFPVSTWYQAISLGAIWGWLPCGLVYSALAYSATQSSAVGGAAIMFSFALGTTPALFAGGLAANSLKKILNNLTFRRLTGALFIAYGSWLLLSLFSVDSAHQHHHH